MVATSNSIKIPTIFFYQLIISFNEICELLKQAGINLNGLFLNADPGFDSEDFRQACQAGGVFPNVKPNPRNSSKTKHEPYLKWYAYF